MRPIDARGAAAAGALLGLALCVLLGPVAGAGETSTASVTLRLIDARTGVSLDERPACVVHGRLDPETRARTFVEHAGRTDRSGLLRLALPAGGVTQLEVHVPGYAHALTEPLDLRADDRRELEVRLARGARVMGRLRSKLTRMPLVDASIAVTTLAHTAARSRSSAGGRFSFEDLPAGEHRLRIEHPECESLEIPILVPEGGVLDLDTLALEPTERARLAVRVFVPGATEAVREYEIDCVWSIGDEEKHLAIEVRGADELRVAFSPGVVALRIAKEGYRPAMVTVRAHAGIVVPVRVRLTPR